MTRITLLPWTTSATLHVAVLVVFGTTMTVSRVDRAEIAGDKTVINSSFTRLPAAKATAAAVNIPKPPQPQPKPPKEDKPRPIPKPLNLEKVTSPDDLPAVESANSRIPRQQTDPLKSRPQNPKSTSTSEQTTTAQTSSPTRVERQAAHLPPKRIEPLPRREIAPTKLIEVSDEDVKVDLAQTRQQTLGTKKTRPAKPLKNPSPVYPADAVRNRLEGLVMLRVTIASDGRVKSVTVAKTSGHALLDKSAREAVLNWRFQPATRGGQPVEWTARLPVRFRLK